jgi:hypothetical protein
MLYSWFFGFLQKGTAYLNNEIESRSLLKFVATNLKPAVVHVSPTFIESATLFSPESDVQIVNNHSLIA